ncbi:SPX domain-containing protein, partial [Piptocephalis cylindrospora]
MKFSHSLQFNAVPEWSEHYLAYSNLKKLIYQIERGILASTAPTAIRARRQSSPEAQNLLEASEAANAAFLPALDRELARITEFYLVQEKKLKEELDRLEQDVRQAVPSSAGALTRSRSTPHLRNTSQTHIRSSSSDMASRDPVGRGYIADPSLLSIEEGVGEGSRISPKHSLTTSVSSLERLPSQEVSLHDAEGEGGREEEEGPLLPMSSNARVTTARQMHDLRLRAMDLYVSLCELRGYCQLNLTGFRKILKKYDKLTRNTAQVSYLSSTVLPAPPFCRETQERLGRAIDRVELIHTFVSGIRDPEENANFLRKRLREQVVFGRNTVWRDMIAEERRVASMDVGESRRPPLPPPSSVSIRPSTSNAPMDATSILPSPSATTATQMDRVSLGKFLRLLFPPSRSFILGLGATIGFILLLSTPIFPDPVQSRCFALLVYVSFLWATEVIPLFVTSIFLPLLVVLLQVMRDPGSGEILEASSAARTIFGAMFSPVIMLLLGGFALAAALSKHHVAKALAVQVLARAGTRPGALLLANMAVAAFASMWISNVAAPVLSFSLIHPILRTLPAHSSFGRALILGIALASNVGGMASPISSPQNVIAIETMIPPPSWPQWFFLSIPLCTLSILLIWLPSADPVTWTQVYVVLISVGTVILWCLESHLHSIVGDMGVLAIIPLVAFFGTGVLSKEDFNNFLWTVIMLAQGGIALGKAVESSGLLHTIARTIQASVHGYGPW